MLPSLSCSRIFANGPPSSTLEASLSLHRTCKTSFSTVRSEK
jgi:hypothetical protein